MPDVQIPDITLETALPATNDFFETGSVTRSAKTLVYRFPQVVGTRAELTALGITGVANNLVVLVVGGATISDGQGYAYRYDSASAVSPNGTTILQPDGGGVGRWIAFATFQVPIAISSLAPIADGTILQNSSGGSAPPTANNALPGQVQQRITQIGVIGGITAAGAWQNGLLRLLDSNNSHSLQFLISDLTDNRTLSLNVGDASRTMNLAGNPTLADWFDQNVKTTGTPTFGSVAIGSNAGKRTTKSGLNIIVNVKDYGATGDGVTNDTAAVNLAIAAVIAAGSYATLYFPPGRYNVSGLTDMDNINHVEVTGVAATIYNIGTSNTMVFGNNCSFITVSDLWLDGGAVSRASGIHLRIYCPNVRVTNCFFRGCSDFAIHFDAPVGVRYSNLLVANCTFDSTLGDGVHFGASENAVVASCVFRNTGDDCVGIVGEGGSNLGPRNITVIGCQMTGSGSRGVAILEATDIVVSGCNIRNCASHGIQLDRYTSNSFFNERITITGCQLYNNQTTGGPLASLQLMHCKRVLVEACNVMLPASGIPCAVANFEDLTIQGGSMQGGVRAIGIVAGVSNVASVWDKLTINCVRFGGVSSETMYLSPSGEGYGGVTLNNIFVTSNTYSYVGGSYWAIVTDVAGGLCANNSGITNSNLIFAGAFNTAVNNNVAY